MSSFQKPESELLKTVLEPLLEDFQYWFSRSRSLLESREIPALISQEQAQLLARVKQGQKEVRAAQALFKAAGRQVGIDLASLVRWHRLVTECWRASYLSRQSCLDGKPDHPDRDRFS